MFFCLHHELSRKTQDNSQTGSSSRLLILWIIVAFLVFLFEVTSLSSVANENDTIAFDNIVFYFALFSGVVSGIFTLLFICRLESIFFHIPFVWVITLSLYVVIQPMYPFMEAFNDRYPSLSIAIFMVAFWAKLSLLSTVHWARDTDRLLYYMVRRLQIFREEKEGKYREAFVTELGVLPEFNTSKSKPDNTENPGEKN